MIDTHTHFDDPRFDSDRDAAYARAHAAGVTAQVVAAVRAQSWPQLKAITAGYPGLYPAYGLHPLWLADHRPEHLNELADWLERERPVAVGECGLDGGLADADLNQQAVYFTGQLRLARRYKLPVVIHARRAVDVVLQLLRRFPGVRGMVHSFSGSEDQANRLLDLGMLLSFGGPLTYPRAKRLRRLFQVLPLEALLLETDAPDQPPRTHPGERNEPAYLPEIVACAAELRGLEPTVLAAAVTANARRLLGNQLLLD